MTRTLRGAWSRRWTLLPLLLLTVIVVTGTVTVIAFAEAADTSAALAVPLLVLGLVAVPATARELAEARRTELGLARLRGVQGGQLSALASAEPLLVLLLGGVVGLGLGVLGGRLSVAVLAPGVGGGTPGPAAYEAGLAIVVVGLVAVVLGMGQTLKEPLADQVRSARRPRPSSATALSFVVLVVVAAVVATYRASTVTPGTSGTPDLLVLAAPALVGLAVGQLAVLVMQGVARVLVRLTRRRGLAGFLAARRLARVADVVTPVRLVVAAATVATLAGTGALQVSHWADETARLRAGGPVRVVVADGSADTALQLTRDLDPDGRWLMAAVLVPGTGSVPARRVYLDLQRYDAVVGRFYAGTPVAAIEPQLHDLVGGAGTSTSDQLTIGVRGVSRRTSGDLTAEVGVDYVDADGAQQSTGASVQIGLDGAPSTVAVQLPGCERGCTLTGVSGDRVPDGSTLPYVIDVLDLGGVDELSRDWTPTEADNGTRVGGLVQVDDGLLVRTATRELAATPDEPGIDVIATDSATWDDGGPMAETPGGDERTAQVVARAAALPLVEADGLLLDLPSAQAGAAPTVPAAEVSVVAAAETPRDVLARLSDRAGSRVTTLQQVADRTGLQTRATQAGVYAVMAGACLLLGLLALGTALARQRAAWRRDLAALRVVGVPTGTLAGSAWREVALLGLTAAGGTALGSLLAVRLLLSHLSLVVVPVHAVPLVTSLAPWPLLAGVGAAAVVVVLAGGWGRSVARSASRPAILREEGTV